jgi:hypothetical protein
MKECACGCKTLIHERDKQYRVVNYVRNHDKRKPIDTVLCACGCGTKMDSRKQNSYRKKTFVPGHQHYLRRLKPIKILCACGCGEWIDNIRRKKDGKPYKVKMQIGHMWKGEDNHFWQGGITESSKLIRQSTPYRKWRKAVFQRDNYTCQLCGIRNEKGVGKTIELNVDHIKSFSNYPNLRFDIDNGRTLCRPCHLKTDTFGGGSRKLLTKLKT